MSDSPLEVYPVGSGVLLDGGVHSARVTAILIRDGVSYEVVWWTDGERHCEEVGPWELLPDGEDNRKRRIDPIL